ncbi:NADH:flavin oxidoreductase [Sandaracinobacter sp. RS1-74]|uniref:NADH:flavin oxidoreductase n=1 Tax=Sandaracinobacteroides sayramensis TaxID=2913411 RepID=UPI001EDC506B|nr:NADH:flavin oxidoreductase [Sandaracinobacteroides sayramensis]MCG2840759.1 NADH:flavin oxidoreductase [Sandaracinobacteroides sayramensis]
MSQIESLFRPFHSEKLDLPNRIVMAPMTRSFSPGGVPGGNVARYYERRAAAQVGLIITEGTVVNRPGAANDPNVPHFHGEAALEGWARVVEAVHAKGGKIAPQLWHVGSAINPRNNDETGAESPSGLYSADRAWGHAMSVADIEATIAAFAQSAASAKRLGFDAVELHGAHGYLIDQFQWQGTNHRDDVWGADRSRFAREVVTAVRAAVGPDFPLILRLSQWKQQDYATKLAASPQALADWLNPLSDAGVDIFHCSQRRFWEPEFEGSELNFAGWAKKLTGKPSITVGSVGLSGEFLAGFKGEESQPTPIDGLVGRLEAGEFDLVAVGRALIVDPDWAVKVREGRQDFTPFDRSVLATLA